MAGQRNIYRIARTLLLALAALLAVGAVGSMFMGARAVNDAKAGIVDQARTIVEDSLPVVLSPQDLSSPATDARADLITAKITPVLLDPTAFDDVAIWSTDGTIVYSTDRSLIGQRPEEARTSVRDATERGTISTEQTDGMFSVLIPFRLRVDGDINAAIQLARPDDPIVAAGRPWRYNAILMTIGLIIALIVLYRVMRLSATSVAYSSFVPSASRTAPGPIGSGPRPIELPSPGLREEADARRKAEERASGAEERLSVIQDQYRKTLEELHVTQRLLQERPAASGADPEIEARLLKAEGQVASARGPVEGDEHGAGQARSPHRRAGEVEGRPEGRPGARSQGPTGRTRSDRAPGGTRRRADRALGDTSRARCAEGAGRSRAGDAGRPGRRPRRGAPRPRVRGIRAERARSRHGRARRRPQRAPRAANRGAEGQRLRRGAPGRARRARQPQGVAPRRAGRARGRPGNTRPHGSRGVPGAAGADRSAGGAPARGARRSADQGGRVGRGRAAPSGRRARGGTADDTRRARGGAPASPRRARGQSCRSRSPNRPSCSSSGSTSGKRS